MLWCLCACQYYCERAGAQMRDEAGYSNQFVVFYDLAARASFHRRAAGNDAAFDIEKEVGHISPAVLLDAKALFAAARV